MKVKHDRPNCIGCGACAAVAPDFFEMADDGKSQLKNGKKLDGDQWEREFEEKDLNTVQEAADACPVNIISIEKQ